MPTVVDLQIEPIMAKFLKALNSEIQAQVWAICAPGAKSSFVKSLFVASRPFPTTSIDHYMSCSYMLVFNDNQEDQADKSIQSWLEHDFVGIEDLNTVVS